MSRQSQIKHFFHWEFSGVLLPLFFGLGVAMALDSDYALAILGFSFFFIWCCGLWFTSDFLAGKRSQMRSLYARKNAARMRKVKLTFRGWKWGVFGLIAALTACCIFLTLQRRLHYQLQALDGTIFPADDPTPANTCNLASDELAVILDGGLEFKASRFPLTVISVKRNNREFPVIRIDRSKDNKSLVLSADIRSQDGKLIVRLDKNSYSVNPNNSMEFKRKDKSTLTIEDQYGNEALKIRYVNPQVLDLSARFFSDGVYINTSKIASSGFCMSVEKGPEGASALDIDADLLRGSH